MNYTDESRMHIHYRWKPVEVSPEVPFTYPSFQSLVSKSIKENHSHAAIYRWSVIRNGQICEAYIGETENLATRINGYLKPGPSQQTNKRLRAHFLAAIESGAEVRLEYLSIDPYRINNVVISESNLGNTHIRKMLENFLLEDHEKDNCEILNFKQNPLERRKRKSLKLKSALEQ